MCSPSPTVHRAVPIWGGAGTSVSLRGQAWAPALFDGPRGLVVVLTEQDLSRDLEIPIRDLARRLAFLPVPVERATWITHHPPRPGVSGSGLLGESFYQHRLEIRRDERGRVREVRVLSSAKMPPAISREEVEALIGGALC